MTSLPQRGALHIAVLALIGMCTGCTGSLAVSPTVAAPAATALPAPQSTTAPPTSESVHLVGLLTLKGPEMGAWWALSDDSGAVWRLEPASVEQAASFRQWQNRRVEVDGVRAGMFLHTPMVKVERAQLVR